MDTQPHKGEPVVVFRTVTLKKKPDTPQHPQQI